MTILRNYHIKFVCRCDVQFPLRIVELSKFFTVKNSLEAVDGEKEDSFLQVRHTSSIESSAHVMGGLDLNISLKGK